MASKLRPGIRVEEYLPIDNPDDEGTYETWWGKAWIHAKIDDPLKPCMLANEFICARLAAVLGLPTLPGEIAEGPGGKRAWVTPRISTKGDVSPPPPTEAAVAAAHPVVVAGMIVFDSWIHNQDRHAYNVLFDPALGLWLIDHEDSLALPTGDGFDNPVGAAAATPLSWHGFRNEAIDTDLLDFWKQRVTAVRDDAIDLPISEANRRGLITVKQGKWLSDYLLARRSNIASLVPKAGSPKPQGELVGPEADDGQINLFDPPEE